MGKYFKEWERYKLETMLQDGVPKKEIAKRLEKSLATIYNEIKRGLVTLLDSDYIEYTVYKADVAQRKSMENQSAKGRDYKIGSDFRLVKFIEKHMLEYKWSPEVITGYIRQNADTLCFDTDICYKTIYNYIHAGLFLNVSDKNLMKYKRKNKKGSSRPSYKNCKGTSIDKRPPDVKARIDFGHWEMDTVIGQRNKKPCLLVLTERKTRMEIIRKMCNKSQDEVKRVLDDMEKELPDGCFSKYFKTITTDNGVEFLDSKKIETSLSGSKRTSLFYCHPYSSWERGTNENLNRMIRRWIPKGKDIADYSEKDILHVEHWINSFPRKIFDFHSSYDQLLELGISLF